MQLNFSVNSPFARKVRVVAFELGISREIRLVQTELRIVDENLWELNPLGQIPVLTTDEGERYFDSLVICEYLNERFGANQLLAANGPARWKAMTTVALADGVTSAGILARLELLRPEAQRSIGQYSFQMSKVSRGLDRLQNDTCQSSEHRNFKLPEIATACAIGWLIFRHGEETVFHRREALADWYRHVVNRPSMQATLTDPGA